MSGRMHDAEIRPGVADRVVRPGFTNTFCPWPVFANNVTGEELQIPVTFLVEEMGVREELPAVHIHST